MEKILASIPAKVRFLRNKLSQTQEQVASRAGISLRQYQSLEAKIQDVKLTTLIKISTAFGVSPVDLILPDQVSSDHFIPGVGSLGLNLCICNMEGRLIYFSKNTDMFSKLSDHEESIQYLWNCLFQENQKDDLKNYFIKLNNGEEILRPMSVDTENGRFKIMFSFINGPLNKPIGLIGLFVPETL